jgi:aminoglycoside 6'-N-acetyltransferase I
MVEIRQLRSDEHSAWLALRERLWPETAREQLSEEQREILRDSARNAVFVAAQGSDLVGFVEAALRDWAEGCDTRPVGYIEGWFVDAGYRRQGVGRRLIEAAEAWARSRGCTEMGSDAELHNSLSHRAHAALGFREIERLVLFSKRIP